MFYISLGIGLIDTEYLMAEEQKCILEERSEIGCYTLTAIKYMHLAITWPIYLAE